MNEARKQVIKRTRTAPALTLVIATLVCWGCPLQKGSSSSGPDTEGPLAGTVNDGAGTDADYLPPGTGMSANWAGFSDRGTGIASYQWTIGRTPGASDVVPWTNVGNRTSAASAATLVEEGTTYFVSVQAVDRAGNLGVIASSNGVTAAQTASSITQFGITWSFDRDYRAGSFANGDWWVLGPVRIVGISPASTTTGGRTVNGSQINPDPTLTDHGYDSTASAGNFVPGLNRALGVTPGNPLTLQPDQTLVSTVSAAAGARPQLEVGAVLTCLDLVPVPGSFRPPYCGTDKTVRFHRTQLEYSRLRSLTPVANVPALSTVEGYFEKPWLDHVPGWTGRYFHPAQNMPDYGREIAVNVGIGALMLHLDFTRQQKETLLIRYVQLGIDLYGVIQAGGRDAWEPDGGHASGRKWPILFAGLMLNDAGMAGIGGQSNVHFGEDGQTFRVVETAPGVFNQGFGGYTAVDRGLAEWGIRHSTYPNMDDRSWTADYRQCCTANSWAGFVLAARIMGVRSMWNHDPLFDYQDRYMTLETAWRQWDAFTEAMWDAYRPQF